ncbi:MAG: glycosyltransferase family 4 protein [Terracidiphilus sp.]
MPLINGGARFIVEGLAEKLREYGHQAEIVYVPSTDEPSEILTQMNAFRLIKLDRYFDRVITFRPPAHVVRHPCKVVWFIHHIRVFYDLWQSSYRPVPDLAPWRALRDTLIRADTAAISEAHRVFTNSQVVSDRLRLYNGLASEVLYPPLQRPELFHSRVYGEEIVSVCRMEHHKRQHLLVEAMRHVQTPVRLRLSGLSQSSEYIASLHRMVADGNLQERVQIESRWITEEEKADRLGGALANVYIPLDEDSYGYPTIEAAQARRCTVTVNDAGGVLEFVTAGINGFIVPPDPRALAAAFDQLYLDRAQAGNMGEQARARIAELHISWDAVVAKLLA